MIRKLFANIGFSNLDGKEFVKTNINKKLYFVKNIYKKYLKSKTIFITGFVEFGCESFYPHYLIPQIKSSNPNYKIIFLGWPNRHFYYKHLVDEYWELQTDYEHLRSASRAMYNESPVIKKLEEYLKYYGTVISSQALGNNLIQSKCKSCNHRFGSIKNVKVCPNCYSEEVQQSILSNIKSFHDNFVFLPTFKKFVDVKKNSVAIFARKRDAYGRNLGEDFYINLIKIIRDLGYEPVWLGEKCSTLPCPISDIVDYTKENDMPIEKTIQIVSECVFSIQLWTASTRISLAAETPFLLIESPDQIYGKGQEGQRLKLFNPKNIPNKVVLCNFIKFVENKSQAIEIIKESIKELLFDKNNEIKIGLVDNPDYVAEIQNG